MVEVFYLYHYLHLFFAWHFFLFFWVFFILPGSAQTYLDLLSAVPRFLSVVAPEIQQKYWQLYQV